MLSYQHPTLVSRRNWRRGRLAGSFTHRHPEKNDYGNGCHWPGPEIRLECHVRPGMLTAGRLGGCCLWLCFADLETEQRGGW